MHFAWHRLPVISPHKILFSVLPNSKCCLGRRCFLAKRPYRFSKAGEIKPTARRFITTPDSDSNVLPCFHPTLSCSHYVHRTRILSIFIKCYDRCQMSKQDPFPAFIFVCGRQALHPQVEPNFFTRMESRGWLIILNA